MKRNDNSDYDKKNPSSSRPLAPKGINSQDSSNVNDPNHNNQRIDSEYDFPDLNNQLLLTETRPKRDLYPFRSSTEDDDPFADKKNLIEKVYLKKQPDQLQGSDKKNEEVAQGVDNSIQKIGTDITRKQLVLPTMHRSVKELKSKRKIREKFDKMPHTAIKIINNLKANEDNIKQKICQLEDDEKSLKKKNQTNLPKSIIEDNICSDQLRDIKEKKEILNGRLDEINARVEKIMSDNITLSRNDKIKQFLEKFSIENTDYLVKRQRYELESNCLKEKRLNDLSLAQEKRKRELDKIEQDLLDKKIRFLTEHHDNETAIVKKRKVEINTQMDKMKQFINEKVTKNERDYLFNINKDRFELEKKKLFEKIRMQKKDVLITHEELSEFNKKRKETNNELQKDNIKKVGLMKEMWKNRSQLLPTFKSQLANILEEEKRKEQENVKAMALIKEQHIKEANTYAIKQIHQPTVNNHLKQERENRIFLINKKRNKKLVKIRKRSLSIKIPILHKKTKSELPLSTKPLKQLDKLPNYLLDLKKERETNISSPPQIENNWDKELNNSKGTIIQNVELLKIKTEAIDQKVQEKKQFMRTNGGYALQTEVGDSIGNLLIDSIKAKLKIINKLKGKKNE